MNHCVEIGCPDCGFVWCCRCYDKYEASTERAVDIRKNKTVKADEVCLNCKSRDTRIM